MSGLDDLRGCVVLAGGSSRRFGEGMDKLLFQVGDGRTLIEVVVARLDFFDEIVISTSTPEKASRYRSMTGMKTVVDSSPGIPGGILSGCRALSTESIFVVGADMPMVKRRVVEQQFSAMEGYQAVVPLHTNGYIEPLHSTIKRQSSLSVLKAICASGERRARSLFENLQTCYLPVESLKALDPDLESFTNVNDERTFRSAFPEAPFPPARNSRSSSSQGRQGLLPHRFSGIRRTRRTADWDT